MTQDLKVLIVQPNHGYLSPNQELLSIAISRFSTVYYYGNGYVDNDTLDKGVQHFLDSIGDIDLIVTSIFFASNYSIEQLNCAMTQLPGESQQRPLSAKMLSDIKNFLKANREKVVVSLLNLDVFASSQASLDSVYAHAAYYIGAGQGCMDFTNPKMAEEPYIKLKKKNGLEIGLYDEFARQNEKNLINLLHIVNDNEFSYNALSLRRHDVSVPGTHYNRRAEIYEHLKTQKNIKMAKRSYDYVFKVLSRLGVKTYSNVYLVRMYNLLFQQLLAHSRVCVTDGGLINFTIRKYLEVPAAGSLLVCWKTTNFADLGFVSGVNSFAIDSNDEVVQLVKEIAQNPNAYQHIADAGQQLILRQHSLSARSTQLHQAFNKIVAQDFHGSFWQNGRFTCR